MPCEDPVLLIPDFDLSKNEDNLQVFHAVLAVSILMIILGSEYETQITVAQNREQLRDSTKGYFFYIVNTWYFAHDNYFFVSGFLASLVYVTRVENSTNAILKSIAVKILRFWPVFLAGLFLFWGITDQLLEGPFFGKHDQNKDQCSSTWYYDVFFVNNYSSTIKNSSCIDRWSWMYSVDLHCFIVEMLVLLVFKDNLTVGKLVAFALTLSLWIASVATATNGEIVSLSNFDKQVTLDTWYYKTHSRAAVHFLGFFLGMFFQAPGSIESYLVSITPKKAFFF